MKDEWTDERTEGWLDGRMHGWLDEWTGGWLSPFWHPSLHCKAHAARNRGMGAEVSPVFVESS